MYQEPFPKHDKGKGSSSSIVNYDYTNHITSFDFLVGRIEPIDNQVNIITIRGTNLPPSQSIPRIIVQGDPALPQLVIKPNPTKIVIQGFVPSISHSQNDYNVTSWCGRVNIQGAPPPPNPPPHIIHLLIWSPLPSWEDSHIDLHPRAPQDLPFPQGDFGTSPPRVMCPRQHQFFPIPSPHWKPHFLATPCFHLQWHYYEWWS